MHSVPHITMTVNPPMTRSDHLAYTHPGDARYLGTYAQAYGRLGFSVAPAHAPLFDHPQGYTCTCEMWRHSESCRTNAEPMLAAKYLEPGQHCENPGKHSWGVRSWANESTTDVETIAAWWAKNPHANVLIDCGKARIVAVDFDTYKPDFDGSLYDELARTGQNQTVTVRSGGGGEQLWYAMPDGIDVPSKNAALSGVDIKASGAYVIAPPSRHKSGNRYEFEELYTLTGTTMLPAPEQVLQLVGAHRARYTGPVTANTERVARAQAHVETVLDYLGIDYRAREWKPSSQWAADGIMYELTDCPFRHMADDPHGPDRTAYVSITCGGSVTSGCHHGRCTDALRRSGRTGWQEITRRIDYVALAAMSNGAAG